MASREVAGGAAASASSVDVASWTEEARRAAEESDGGLDTELWATYARLGEVLDSGRSDEDYVAECEDLVAKLVRLGWALDHRWQQQVTALVAKTTTKNAGR